MTITTIMVVGVLCGFGIGIVSHIFRDVGLEGMLRFTKCCLTVVGAIIEAVVLLALLPLSCTAFVCGYVFALLRNAFIAGMRKL